jgi:hypothetical protein
VHEGALKPGGTVARSSTGKSNNGTHLTMRRRKHGIFIVHARTKTVIAVAITPEQEKMGNDGDSYSTGYHRL